MEGKEDEDRYKYRIVDRVYWKKENMGEAEYASP